MALVRAAVERHPAVRAVELVGSRTRGDPTPLSDSDFLVCTEPPWVVTRATLPAVDAHFWDWIVWLGGKQLRGNRELVHAMLSRVMYEHLLAPMGAPAPPATIAEAVALYSELRDTRERELGVALPRELESVVKGRLATNGVL